MPEFSFIIIIIIVSIITVFAGVRFVHQPGANHAPRTSVTQVNHSVHTLSTFLRIRADPSMQILLSLLLLLLLLLSLLQVKSVKVNYNYFTLYEVYTKFKHTLK